MSQTFILILATDSIAADAKQLGVSPAQLQDISIQVDASIVQKNALPYSDNQIMALQLWLSYQIQLPSSILAEQLCWPAWREDQVGFADYLWEQTCLECFISSDSANSIENDNSYIEMNASPSGQYAFYHFQSYRNPAKLPPVPLIQASTGKRAHIIWPATQSKPSKSQRYDGNYNYHCRLGFSLDQLPYTSSTKNGLENLNHDLDNSLDSGLNISNTNAHHNAIKFIHPCVILWFGDTALYFAPAHASPPDFHQRRFWSHFDYQAAAAT